MVSVISSGKLFRLMLSLSLLISCLSSSAYSQNYHRQDALPSIPLYFRERLTYRLETFVSYYQSKQFDMVYEMLSPAYREGMTNVDGTHPSKEEWVKEQEGWRENVGNRGIMYFKLEKAWLIADSWDEGLVLEGCVQFNNSYERYKYETHAILEDGEWYFWDIVQHVSCAKCKPVRCDDSANSQ